MELVGLGVLLVFALGIIVLWTRGVFARDLTQALKRVNQQEQELQARAEILEQRLAQMEREYHANLKRAAAEAERLLQDAKGQAVNIRSVAIEEAKHRARHLLLEAEQARLQLKAELAKELNGATIQRLCESLRALLPPADMASLHRALATELLESLQRMDRGSWPAGVTRVEVTTAQPLEPTQSKQLSQWVAEALGPAVAVHLATEASLIAGCLVRIGSTVVDNTLSNRLMR